MNARSSGRHKVVIVGGGFGGLPAARWLGRKDVAVTLVQRGEVLAYRICPTSGASLLACQLHRTDEIRKPRHLELLPPLTAGQALELIQSTPNDLCQSGMPLQASNAPK